MKAITTQVFKDYIELDPAWASKLTEPIEITDHCDMSASEITHLSPLLHFNGKEENGNCASFANCKSLKVAEGNFLGFVDFSSSGVEKIGDITCGRNNLGTCASFARCDCLKIAEGIFPGYVDFSTSSIEKIGELLCEKDVDGNSASFHRCKSLKITGGTFPGLVSFSCSGIEKIRNLTCGASASFWGCRYLKVAEGNFPRPVNFANSNIEKIGDLTCGVDHRNIRLDVTSCENLKKIPIRFDPKEIEADPELAEKLKADRLRDASKKHLRTGIIEI